MQDCDTPKAAWDNLQDIYAGRTMVNKLRALNNLLNTKCKNDIDVRFHIANLESQYSCLVVVWSTFEESLKAAIMLSSVSNLRRHAPIMASTNSLKEETATSDYVTNTIIEKNRG